MNFTNSKVFPSVPERYLPVESRIADFLAVAQPDLRKFLDTNQQDAAEMLLRLISWLAQSRQGPVAARRIVSTAPEKIVEMTSLARGGFFEGFN